MPRVRKPAPRRKRLNRRRAPKRVLTNVNRSLQPFADRYICKQKYATTVTTNGVGQYQMNLNSLFDPDRTGAGRQPYGYDTLSSLYNRYRVISCGWRVQQPVTNAGSAVTTACLSSNDNSLLFLEAGTMLENPRTKYITQIPGATAVTLKGKQHLPTLVGRTKAQYMADDQYQANVLSSPNEFMVLYLQTFLASSGLPINGVGLQIIMEFTVEYFDLKHVVPS